MFCIADNKQEATSTSVSLEVRQDFAFKTAAQYRHDLVIQTFHRALATRLTKLALGDDPPFLSASSDMHNPLGFNFFAKLSLSCKDGGESTAVVAALTEVERIRVHGLSDREVNTAKRNMLTEVRSEYLERHQTDSATLCDELVEHYCKGIPAPGIEWEAGVMGEVLQGVTTAEVNAIVQSYQWGAGSVVHIARPSKSFIRRALSHVTSAATKITGLGTTFSAAAAGNRLQQHGSESQHTGASGELTEDSVRALLHQFTTAKYSAESLADWTHQPHSSSSSNSSSSSKAAKQQQLQQSSIGTAASATDSNTTNAYMNSTADSISDAAVHASGNSSDTDDNSSDSSSVNEYDSFATLLPDDIQPGSIVNTMHFPGENNELDCHELVLSNGMHVTYKQTDFMDDEILYSLYANGACIDCTSQNAFDGASGSKEYCCYAYQRLTELPAEHLADGRMAVTIAEEFGKCYNEYSLINHCAAYTYAPFHYYLCLVIGVFGIHPAQLSDMLTGHRVSLGVDIDALGRSCGGECGKEDLETALQL
eukprot:7990-Heterococcus_DN1.PRE.1